jgi:NAD(P)-dependent dehydrogenase (short-subunit alcohol dehydrogenase family)
MAKSITPRSFGCDCVRLGKYRYNAELRGTNACSTRSRRPSAIKVTVVEPGYFCTEFLEGNSLVESLATIADYDGTAGEVRKIAKAVTLNQPGDPDKFADAMIALVEAHFQRPPIEAAFV